MVCSFRWALIALTLAAFAGCADDAVVQQPQITYREPEALAVGDEQIERLCSRGRSDVVLDVFCDDEHPSISSLAELRSALGMAGDGYEVPFALNGHSTSLVARSVSAFNPRAIFVREPSPRHEMMMIAFARGHQFSELVTRDRVGGELQFYLFTFEQPCNRDGCVPGDLLTEAAETDWQSFNVYAEEDLANTPRDCRSCHQPGGPGTPKLLRMQELEPPWNHWFYTAATSGRALIADYIAAKGEEPYAGLTATQISLDSQPGVLAAAVYFANRIPQPNLFVSAQIETEVNESAAALGGNQPDDNSIPGDSATWDAIYERSRSGEAITVPYHDVKVSDPAKLAAMTAAYTDYRAGRLAREDLPDIREVLPDDEMLLARMGFATEPGMSGDEVLLQACAQCHNDNLDQSLSRARFNVDLSSMTREEKERAIARVSLSVDDPSVMPPALFRHLSADAKQKLMEVLER